MAPSAHSSLQKFPASVDHTTAGKVMEVPRQALSASLQTGLQAEHCLP